MSTFEISYKNQTVYTYVIILSKLTHYYLKSLIQNLKNSLELFVIFRIKITDITDSINQNISLIYRICKISCAEIYILSLCY